MFVAGLPEPKFFWYNVATNRRNEFSRNESIFHKYVSVLKRFLCHLDSNGILDVNVM